MYLRKKRTTRLLMMALVCSSLLLAIITYNAIAAVVLGGTSLSGGKGRILGTLIGALIIGVLNNGLNIIGVSAFWQQVVKGVVILIAVLIDRFKVVKQ